VQENKEVTDTIDVKVGSRVDEPTQEQASEKAVIAKDVEIVRASPGQRSLHSGRAAFALGLKLYYSFYGDEQRESSDEHGADRLKFTRNINANWGC